MTIDLKAIWNKFRDGWDKSANATLDALVDSRSSIFEEQVNNLPPSPDQ